MQQDVTIIGGGIVGLATGLKILEQEPTLNLTILEKEPQVAAHQTGHNSGVIHSGVYYKPGSLKAINCTKGYQMLVHFCEQEAIPYDICGKVIVATEEWELPILEKIYNRGTENGLTGLTYLDEQALKAREPHINGIKGIYVPQTGIVDYQQVARKYATKIEERGGKIIGSQSVIDIKINEGMAKIQTESDQFNAKLVINCGGLYSDKIARMTHPDIEYRIIPFRGEYFNLKKDARHLVKNLIYPVPDPNFPFLGVHFTREIDGGIEAGPNAVFALKREGYNRTDFNIQEAFESLTWPGFQKVIANYWKTGFGEMYRSFSKPAFTKALQKLVPEIQQHHLKAGGSGVRAQACDRHGGLVDDFVIFEDEHVVHVLNAPSPAATSSLSIGETVANKGMKILAEA